MVKMRKSAVLCFTVVISISLALANPNYNRYATLRQNDVRKFPDGFLFGTATASYQVEGAWNADGKSENIWDHLTHTDPCSIKDCSNGDVAANSYYLYERDVEMMRELGIDFYRFSLSWTRIMPTGFPNEINQAGVDYYNNLIDEMLKYNIEPMITLYHWDLPQRLQDMGGWTNPLISDWFGDYARVAFEKFGDRVKLWITMNEPREICHSGYANGQNGKAPRLEEPGFGEYMCAKNLIVAHAKAWHIYNNDFRSSQDGIVGITLSAGWIEPETDTPENVLGAEEAMQFEWGLYAHPVFSETGNYPPIMIERIGAKSAAQGFARSRLPEFTEQEVSFVRGTSDFFGLNHYTSSIAYVNASVYNVHPVPSYYDDVDVATYQDPEWPTAASGWLKVVPWGFYKLFKKIKDDFNNPPVFVTENGYSTFGGLNDDDRISYYRSYLDAMLDAIDEGCDIRSYAAWSLMDNFEWKEGYIERFGLYEVNYQHPDRIRTPRKSAFVYKQIVSTRELDFNYEPDTLLMTIDDGH